jgi:hypothetical protein
MRERVVLTSPIPPHQLIELLDFALTGRTHTYSATLRLGYNSLHIGQLWRWHVCAVGFAAAE